MPKLPKKVLAWLKRNQQVVNIVWDVQAGPSDRMPTINLVEAQRFPARQAYLLAKNDGRGKKMVFRLFDGSDRMASKEKAEGGHKMEGLLGAMWTKDPPPGTQRVLRGYNPTTHDHTLLTGGGDEDGYIKQDLGGYAYRRRLPRWAPGDHQRNTRQWQFTELRGTAVIVSSSEFAGGSLAGVTWNGKEFVNRHDVGRLIQSSLSLSAQRTSGKKNEAKQLLPTEGGDEEVTHLAMPFWHGAPTYEIENVGSTQKTRAIPVEWKNAGYVNKRTPEQLILYKNMLLGKDLTLDCVTLGGGYDYLNGQVLRYRTIMKISDAYPDLALMEIPTGYLNPEFRQTFFVDATKDDLDEGLIPVVVDPGKAVDQSLSAGGAVLATDDFQFAMGIYGRGKSAGGDVSAFQISNYLQHGSMKWAAIHEFAKSIPKGTHSFITYIAVGTLDHVRAIMRRLWVEKY